MPSSRSEPTRAPRQWTEVDLGLDVDVIDGRGSSRASLDVEAVTWALGAVEGVWFGWRRTSIPTIVFEFTSWAWSQTHVPSYIGSRHYCILIPSWAWSQAQVPSPCAHCFDQQSSTAHYFFEEFEQFFIFFSFFLSIFTSLNFVDHITSIFWILFSPKILKWTLIFLNLFILKKINFFLKFQIWPIKTVRTPFTGFGPKFQSILQTANGRSDALPFDIGWLTCGSVTPDVIDGAAREIRAD
jgi:hypothetical protein